MTHEDLLELGFRLCGVEENDPFYRIYFESPFKFGVCNLSGNLDNGKFLLYDNSEVYTNKTDLKKIIDVIGSKVYLGI